MDKKKAELLKAQQATEGKGNAVFVNFDELILPKKFIVWGGKKYEVKDLSTEETVQINQIVYERAPSTDEDAFSIMAKVIKFYIPDFDMEEARQQPLIKLGMLQKYLLSNGILTPDEQMRRMGGDQGNE